MVIYVDIHGVLANLAGAVVDNYNRQHGTHWTQDDVKNWDWSPVIHPSQNWLDYTHTEGFWRNLPLYPWAKDLVTKVKATGHLVAFLSDLPTNTENDHRIWLDKHFGNGTNKHLIVTKRKDLVARQGSILIDDSPSQIDATRRAGCKVLPLKQPWNTEVSSRYSIEEIFKELEKLNG
jgi:5'(3')-deoxyribonucleotidase